MSTAAEEVRTALASNDFGERLRAVNQFRSLDRGIAFDLVQIAVKDSNARVRYAAVSHMAHLGDQNPQLSLEILRNCLLNDDEMDVRAAAADALGGLKLTDAFDDIVQLYESTSEWLVQFSILAALGELGDPRGFEVLIRALSSDQNLLRLAAIGALGDLGNADAVPYLAAYVDDPDWHVRYRLVQSLQQLGGTEAEGLLAHLATDSMPQVAEAARTEAPD
mgnify:CR=1 FL=1